MSRTRENKTLAAVIGLGIVGMGLAAFLVYDHYLGSESCSLDPWIGCGEVNRGPYSTILGVPWSVIGLAGFTSIAVLACVRRYHPERDRNELIMPAISGLSLAGVASVVYLNYLEFAVINKICPYCAASHVVMLLIASLVLWWLFLGRFRGEKTGQLKTDTESAGES